MKFPKKCMVEKVLCADEYRVALSYAHLDVKNKVLVATNGHAMAIIPVDLDATDTEGPVSEEAIKAARKAAVDGAAEVVCNGHQVVPQGPTFERPEACSFPDYEQVVPKDVRKSVGVNAKLLWDACQAIGAFGSKDNGDAAVTISFGGPLDPIRVEKHDALTNRTAVAVIMPMRK